MPFPWNFRTASNEERGWKVLCRAEESPVGSWSCCHLPGLGRAGQGGCETQTEVISSPDCWVMSLHRSAGSWESSSGHGIFPKAAFAQPVEHRQCDTVHCQPRSCGTGAVRGRKNWITRELLSHGLAGIIPECRRAAGIERDPVPAALPGLQLHPLRSHTRRKL